MLHTDGLSKANAAFAESIWADTVQTHAEEGGPYIRFQDKDTVQIDGDMFLEELEALARIMKDFPE